MLSDFNYIVEVTAIMLENLSGLVIPQHVGIIMDGNGRWAKKRGLPRTIGHQFGAKNFRKVTRYISKTGVRYLTLYAFSTENWKRPFEEVNALMGIFKQYLIDSLTDFKDDDIKIVYIGDRSGFDPALRKLIDESEENAKDRKGMQLNIAMNYGARDELLRSVRMIARDVRDGKLDPEQITSDDIADRLYTGGMPDPDLIIRTGGEFRLSNFLLYQSAYSEFYSTDVLWPDFHEEQFDEAIRVFNQRNRRFGGV